MLVLSRYNSASQEALPPRVQFGAACAEVYGFELPAEGLGRQTAKGT